MAYRTGCGAAAEMAPASSSSSSSSSSSASSVLLSQTLSGDVSGFYSEKRRCEGKNRVPSGLLLLSAAIPRPLKDFGHNSNLKLSDTVAAVPPLLGHLLSSLASAPDSFKGFGHSSNIKWVDTVAAVPPPLGHLHSWFASVAVDSLKGFRHNSNLKLADTVAVVSPLVGHLHFSFASVADSFKGFLHSLSFRLQTFFHQVPCRNLQSTNSLSNHSDIKKMNSLSNHSFAAILPGDSVAGVVVTNGILNFLNIYNTLLVVRLVLTWFPNTPPAIVSPLSMLCDPYLNIFRGLIPPLGGTLDVSPILAFLVLNAFTNTASALPAELPSSAVSQVSFRSTRLSGVTSSQRKWMRRLCGNR